MRFFRCCQGKIKVSPSSKPRILEQSIIWSPLLNKIEVNLNEIVQFLPVFRSDEFLILTFGGNIYIILNYLTT